MEHIHSYLGMYLINYNIQSVFYFGFFGLCSMISSPFFALADQGPLQIWREYSKLSNT